MFFFWISWAADPCRSGTVCFDKVPSLVAKQNKFYQKFGESIYDGTTEKTGFYLELSIDLVSSHMDSPNF